MPSDISLKMDLSTGLIELNAPADRFNEVFAQAKEMVDSFQSKQKLTPHLPEVPSTVTAPFNGEQNKIIQRGRVRQTGGSSGRPGRIGSFEPVDFGLSEEKERRLIEFYKEKAPIEQTHQIAVAMYQGEKELGRKSFSYNEIYSLLRLSGEKTLPKALDVVISKMTKENWAVRDAEGISLKFVARDFVEESLPAQ